MFNKAGDRLSASVKNLLRISPRIEFIGELACYLNGQIYYDLSSRTQV